MNNQPKDTLAVALSSLGLPDDQIDLPAQFSNCANDMYKELTGALLPETSRLTRNVLADMIRQAVVLEISERPEKIDALARFFKKDSNEKVQAVLHQHFPDHRFDI